MKSVPLPGRKPVFLKTDRAEIFDEAVRAQLSNDGLMIAIKTYFRLLEEQPNDGDAWNNLALALSCQAQHKPALMAHRKALRLYGKVDHPHISGSHSGYCMSSLYSDEMSVEEIAELHLQAGSFFAETPTNWRNDRDPDRKLKLGFASMDFHEHSVMFFLMPFFRHYDRDRFEVVCYHDASAEDHYTEKIKGLVDGMIKVIEMDSAQIAQKIRADRVDILVDLAGHTARRMLNVFAVRAAPVQVTYCGYPHTSGLETMDYRLVDSITDPEGYEKQASETLVRLPRCFLCFEPSPDALETCPERVSGPFTFTSFNAYNKITDTLLIAWSEILRRAPGTQLLVKASAFHDPETVKLAYQRFDRAKIPRKRVQIVGRLDDKADHFQLYEQVDLMLDATPYNGTTTTCEALYHGVPVLTTLGDRHSARVSASLLCAIGQGEMCVKDLTAYVETAVRIAKGHLKPLRGEPLRTAMRESMLMDAEGHTRELEQTFREMWRKWVA